MNWRTDKPTADVIVVKIKYIGCYMVFMKKGQDYYSMDVSIGKLPLETIEKWADLEEDETVTDCYQLEKELDKWRYTHFQGDELTSGEYLTRESQLDLARHFYQLGLNARKEE